MPEAVLKIDPVRAPFEEERFALDVSASKYTFRWVPENLSAHFDDCRLQRAVAINGIVSPICTNIVNHLL